MLLRCVASTSSVQGIALARGRRRGDVERSGCEAAAVLREKARDVRGDGPPGRCDEVLDVVIGGRHIPVRGVRGRVRVRSSFSGESEKPRPPSLWISALGDPSGMDALATMGAR